MWQFLFRRIGVKKSRMSKPCIIYRNMLKNAFKNKILKLYKIAHFDIKNFSRHSYIQLKGIIKKISSLKDSFFRNSKKFLKDGSILTSWFWQLKKKGIKYIFWKNILAIKYYLK